MFPTSLTLIFHYICPSLVVLQKIDLLKKHIMPNHDVDKIKVEVKLVPSYKANMVGR
jgi:hypothetical protein